jgi:hypothetical protein
MRPTEEYEVVQFGIRRSNANTGQQKISRRFPTAHNLASVPFVSRLNFGPATKQATDDSGESSPACRTKTFVLTYQVKGATIRSA